MANVDAPGWAAPAEETATTPISAAPRAESTSRMRRLSVKRTSGLSTVRRVWLVRPADSEVRICDLAVVPDDQLLQLVRGDDLQGGLELEPGLGLRQVLDVGVEPRFRL